MRIKRLEFRAFGPFTDRVLDFASVLPGLHVVHGPNEAGKSSAMRGLNALLFGFPPRTSDNFLHPYEQLLVGGCLQQADGEELCFLRRKKAKNDLFDMADNPLPAEVLKPFLHGLGQDTFTSMHGIDHETLVQGGQGILDQKGEVGQALFAAGAGFASLKSILKGLEDEADELFKPRATTRAMAQALVRYRELQGQLRLASLNGQEWQKHRHSLIQAEGELATLQKRRLDLDREIRRLERLRRALPYLGERHLFLEKLQAMGDVFPLPAEFGSRRRELEDRRRTVRVRLDGAEARLAALRERQAVVSFNRGVLDHSEDIENLHQRLGAYRKGLEDRPGLEGLRKGFKIDAAHLLRRVRSDLDVEQAESLRPGLGKRRTVQTLAQRHEAVVQAVRQAETRLRELRREREVRAAELAGLGPGVDVSSLAQALNVVRKAGDLDEELRVRGLDGERIRQACQAALQRLGLWSGSLGDMAVLPVPLSETVNEFEAALQRIDEDLRRHGLEEERVVQGLEILRRDMAAIEHAAEVPSEAELASCRGRREEGWGLLRRGWMNGEDVEAQSRDYDPHHPLPDAYEQWVLLADQTADRMYREADRVQKHAQLLAGIESAQAALAETRARIDAARVERTDLVGRWGKQWAASGIDPRGPREMRAWLANFETLRLQVEDLDRNRSELDNKAARRDELRALLLRELEAVGEQPRPGDGLGPALRQAEAVAENLREDAVRREALARSIRDLEEAVGKAEDVLETARQDLTAWQKAWTEAMLFLGLPASASPEEAADYVDTVQECLAKLDEEDVLLKRIAGIDRDARAFESGVRILSELVVPDDLVPAEMASGEPVFDAALAVGRLKALLSQAVRGQTVAARLEEDVAEAVREIRVLGEDLAVVEDGLAALRLEVRCVDDEGMVEAERRFVAWSELRRGLDEVEANLARMAEGGTLEDLEAMAREGDADALPGQIAARRAELEDVVDPRIRELAEGIGREKNELARMDGGDAAARIAEEMQEVLAGISRMTGRYIRLKVASGVLHGEIERYRAAHQDPLLSLASDLFRDLTLGSFGGLRADMDEGDRPVLLGLRPGGERVRVDGMSSGTRDQLYLSLRLASLAWRARSMEPMPFIVDDILINFDEMRSAATLRVLAGMAEGTQIILFTHQAHIADLARSMGQTDRIFVHGL